MLKSVLFLLSGLWLSVSLAGTDRIYMSPMEKSRWTLTTDTPILCEIEHEIPRFGKAYFYQESGRDLRMRFVSDHHFKKDMDVAFRTVTANWKSVHYRADLGHFKTSGSNNPLFRVESDAARHAYFELQQGYQPSLFFVDEEDGYNSVEVVLSTVRFRDVEPDFGRCLSNLHGDNFEDINHAIVHFDFDEEFPIESEEENALAGMLAYFKVDPDVQKFVIEGHTDFKGTECYNETLSARRAWYVYDLLIASGIDPKMLDVEFYGETRPLAKGKDDESRAANRRVHVTLIKNQ